VISPLSGSTPELSRKLELRLLGGTGLLSSQGAEIHSVLAQPKRLGLLVYLALAAPGRMQRRDPLLALFWPESDEEHARGSLRTSLHFLRRSLGEQVIETRGAEEVGLAPDALWCDALAFRAALDAANWKQAVQLYGGPLLPGFAVEEAAEWQRWLDEERDRLARGYARALEGLAEEHEAAGDRAGAVEHWRRLALEEPYQSRIALRLMRALAAGDRAAAIEHARLFQGRLREELAVEPDPEVEALAEELRSAPAASAPTPQTSRATAPAAPASVPAEPARPATDLPLPPTPLLGREAELTAVLGTLMRENVRLLTLTGAGGIGKTRLALAAAREAQPHFPDGAFFVDLAPLADPALVVRAVGDAVGVREAGATPLPEVLRHHLAGRGLLLVLDNFEHLLEAASELAPLLGAAPRLKVLVTSREPLHLRGEHEHPVPPLGRYPATELFAARARAVRPDFELTERNAAVVASLCSRLDGLPLAIELAAARSKLLPPHQILARLESSLKLLTGGARDLPARHQTLRAAIGWSHDLLGEGERRLLRRLAVFAGGCTIETAEAVCGAGSGSLAGSGQELEIEVIDGLASLLDKSLLVRREGADGEEPRYTMLETIQEYARERLEESGEADTIRGRHAQCFLVFAEQAEQGTKGEKQAQWLQRLEDEHDNLRTALRGLLDCGQSECALRVAAALAPFWYLRSYLTEGRQWLREALQGSTPGDPTIRAKALYGAGRLTFKQDPESARVLTEECLSTCRTLGEPALIGRALNLLAAIVLNQGRVLEAEPLLEESIRLQREAGNRTGETVALGNLAMLAYQREDYERAAVLYEQGLELAREVGNTAITADMLGNLGEVLFRLGNLQHAATLSRESLLAHQEVGNRVGIGLKLVGLAGIASAQAQPIRAARLFSAAEAVFAYIGSHVQPNARGLYDRDLAVARAQLDEPAWQSAWAEGQAMSLDDAIALALQE
jgi:predicted ATPase/DNA-binding SARP family transcriptional activator